MPMLYPQSALQASSTYSVGEDTSIRESVRRHRRRRRIGHEQVSTCNSLLPSGRTLMAPHDWLDGE